MYTRRRPRQNPVRHQVGGYRFGEGVLQIVVAGRPGACGVLLRLGGRPGAPWRPAAGGDVGVVASLGPQLGKFVAVSVGLAFGALRPGPKIGAQLVAVAGGISAETG